MIEVSEKCDENSTKDEDPDLPISFNQRRHTQVIEGVNCINQSWRMKDRVSVFFFFSHSRKIQFFFYLLIITDENCKCCPCLMLKCWC